MFSAFNSLTRRQKTQIIVAMLIMIVPMGLYALYGSLHMHENKIEVLQKYNEKVEITPDQLALLDVHEDAIDVTVGMYVESITDVSVKDNNWKAKFQLWFRWEGDTLAPEEYPGQTFLVGNGTIGSKQLMEEYHQDGVHYQLYRITATMEKYFDTTRYPLDSHQLKIFIEDDRDISEVRYVADHDNSGHSPYLTIAGFDILGYDSGLYLNEYASNMGSPELEAQGYEGKKTFEFEFVTRVNRGGYGLFLKAFLSLLSILLWVCIGLYNCAYNQTDAMGAINTGIFGVVSSMIVGMNLLSDARGSGLIEYINFFALAMILLITIYVIRINRFRARQEPEAFTNCYAKALFWSATLLSIGSIVSLVLCSTL